MICEEGRRGAVRIVMLVEDDPSFLRVMCHLIQEWGFRVIPCRNGSEALDVLKYIHPDLIISDLDMPIIDGIKLFKKCRSYPGLREIPFFIISGVPDPEEMLKEVREDLSGFYKKPIGIDLLKRIVSGRDTDSGSPEDITPKRRR